MNAAIIVVAAVELITLHLIDGRTIQVNPAQVTNLQEARDAGDPAKKLHDKTNCVVRFTDGSYTAVAEDCGAVRKLMEGVR